MYDLSLAPSRYSSGFMKTYPVSISTAALISSKHTELPSMRSAVSLSPLPHSIENSGTPPIPNSAANAVMNVTIGKVMPTPVSTMLSPPLICPRYILSTTL